MNILFYSGKNNSVKQNSERRKLMKSFRKITAALICFMLVISLAATVFATGIGGGAGMGMTGSGASGGGSGMSGALGMDDLFGGDMTDNNSDSTLGDLDGDGVIENENGMAPGNRDTFGQSMTGEGEEAPDDILGTTGEMGRSNGTEPISGTTQISGSQTDAADAESDSAMSWTAIIIAVLLAAALIAVVIALIPKKTSDKR